MSTEIHFGKTVSLKQAAQIIMATPNNRYLLQGEPGIGKSSLLGELTSKLKGHLPAYLDVPNMDLGDIAMPVIDHTKKITCYYPNSRFRLHEGKPVIIMLDEYTKGADPIKNMLHPLLEVHNPRLGDIPIDPESIVFLTGNLSSDGIGDSLKAHSRNRIIPLLVRKPSAEEWLDWALNNGIDPVVCAWVDRYQQCMASYLDGDSEKDNPYIYNPRKVQTAFVSPRSLERVSNVIKKRREIDSDSLIAAMTGAVGEAASRDMQAFVAYQYSDIRGPRQRNAPTTLLYRHPNQQAPVFLFLFLACLSPASSFLSMASRRFCASLKALSSSSAATSMCPKSLFLVYSTRQACIVAPVLDVPE